MLRRRDRGENSRRSSGMGLASARQGETGARVPHPFQRRRLAGGVQRARAPLPGLDPQRTTRNLAG